MPATTSFVTILRSLHIFTKRAATFVIIGGAFASHVSALLYFVTHNSSSSSTN